MSHAMSCLVSHVRRLGLPCISYSYELVQDHSAAQNLTSHYQYYYYYYYYYPVLLLHCGLPLILIL